jgi:hypothetical protein
VRFGPPACSGPGRGHDGFDHRSHLAPRRGRGR